MGKEGESCHFKCDEGRKPTGATECVKTKKGTILKAAMCEPLTSISAPGEWCPEESGVETTEDCKAAALARNYTFGTTVAPPGDKAPSGCFSVLGENKFQLNENPQTDSPGNKKLAAVCFNIKKTEEAEEAQPQAPEDATKPEDAT